MLTLRRTRKLIPPPWYQSGVGWGGGVVTPLGFCGFTIFLKYFTSNSGEIECNVLQDKVNIMGYSAAGDP